LLYNGNCITCHKATKAESAPSMLYIQTRYKEAFTNKQDFISYMSKWVLNPNKDGSLMSDKIKKYGLMPNLSFDEETLIDISTFIYENDFEKNGQRYWKK
jgi:hypothetical protein